MRFSEVIELIGTEYTRDEIGQHVETKLPPRRVYANPYSVTDSRYEASGVNEMNPDAEYVIRTAEYQGEKLLRARGEELEITRVIERGEWTHIVCVGVRGR